MLLMIWKDEDWVIGFSNIEIICGFGKSYFSEVVGIKN